LPDLGDGVDHPLGKRELGAREHLRRILETELRVRLLRGKIADQARMRRRQFDDAIFVQAEHDAPHHRCDGVVQVHDDTLGATQ
jgi:hypothetical protein